MRPDLLFDNFNLVTEAPDGIPKMREMILQLAVSGKLVPQDPDDEPASELLKRIAAEKERLIKEGKIKKQKPLPPIEPDEVPYELPEGWEWIRLGNILKISSGKALPSYKMGSGKIPVYGGNGITGYHDEFFVEKPSIIVGRVGYYCGSVHLCKQPCWVTDNAFITYFSENNIHIEFLYWLLKTINLKQNVSATAQPVISGKKVYSIIASLPPLEGQRRIAIKIECLMALCDQMEAEKEKTLKHRVTLNSAAIDHLLEAKSTDEFDKHWHLIANNFDLLYDNPENVQKLRQAILQLAVSGKLVSQDPSDEPATELLKRIKAEKDRLIKEGRIKKQKPLPPIDPNEVPYELPEGWEWAKLGQVSVNIHYGYTASAKENIKDVRLLRITDIQNGKVEWDNVPGCEIDNSKIDYYKLNPGDLLIARTGGTIGKTYIIDKLSVCAVFASYLIRAIPFDHIYSKYLKYFCEAPIYWEQLYAGCSGTGQPNVNATALKNLNVPLPPQGAQKRIVEKVDQLMALCDQMEACLENSSAQADILFKTLVEQVTASSTNSAYVN